jgi:prepilin-type N-terminal cleavage/methylation domain-containing protein
MTYNTENSLNKHGFTLIELSIVLVIIGLIVGGVLVGKDMIKSAEIRSTVKQYQEFQTAVNIFRNKYNGLPGDLLVSKASAFGLCPENGCMSGNAGYGDGNGSINSYSENFAFWNQLYWAELISGDFGAANPQTASEFSFGNPGAIVIKDYLPPSKLKSTIYWNASQNQNSGGDNYYTLGGIAQLFYVANKNIVFENKNTSLTPTEAFQLDSKLDDGKPRTGKVLAKAAVNGSAAYDSATTTAAWSTATASSAASGDCITGGTSASDTANIYATSSSAAANTPACLLRLNF